MSEDKVELTQDEQDDIEYLAAFAKENGSEVEPSADEAKETAAAEPKVEAPDDKDPEVGGDDTPPAKGKASDVTPEEKDDPYAWIDALPEDVREQAKALRHQFVSTNGRISAYQSRLDAAANEIDALKAVASTRKPAGTSTKPKEDDKLTPELEEFIEKYPQLATSIRAMIAKEMDKVEDTIDERITPLTESAALAKAREARDTLSTGASEIFDTPNTGVHYKDVIRSDLYKNDFLAAQPKEYQEMARTTSDPATALMVMRQFMDFARQYADDNGLVEGKDNPSTGSKADKTSAKRQANREGAGTPPPKSAVTDPSISGSYEDEFKRLNAPKKN